MSERPLPMPTRPEPSEDATERTPSRLSWLLKFTAGFLALVAVVAAVELGAFWVLAWIGLPHFGLDFGSAAQVFLGYVVMVLTGYTSAICLVAMILNLMASRRLILLAAVLAQLAVWLLAHVIAASLTGTGVVPIGIIIASAVYLANARSLVRRDND